MMICRLIDARSFTLLSCFTSIGEFLNRIAVSIKLNTGTNTQQSMMKTKQIVLFELSLSHLSLKSVRVITPLEFDFPADFSSLADLPGEIDGTVLIPIYNKYFILEFGKRVLQSGIRPIEYTMAYPRFYNITFFSLYDKMTLCWRCDQFADHPKRQNYMAGGRHSKSRSPNARSRSVSRSPPIGRYSHAARNSPTSPVSIGRPVESQRKPRAHGGHPKLSDRADEQFMMRRSERLRTGRTAEELRQHLDDAYPTYSALLSPDEKNELIRETLRSEASFMRLQEIFLRFHH